MPDLRAQLREDLKTAMRARDVVRRETIRLLEAAIQNAEIERRGPLAEADLLALIQRQIKQRQDSGDQFRAGNRPDLAEREEQEMAVLQQYLPAQLSRQDVEAAARAVIARVGASGPREKGKVMAPLMQELRGKADGGLVNAVVTDLLGE